MPWQTPPATLATSPRFTITGGYQGPNSGNQFCYVRTGYAPPDLTFIHDATTGLVYLLGSVRLYNTAPGAGAADYDLHSNLPAEYLPVRPYVFTSQPDNSQAPTLTVTPDGRLLWNGPTYAHSDGNFGAPYYTTLTLNPTFYPLNL